MAGDAGVAPPPRVLLFEPDDSLRRVLNLWLTEEGFAVTAFAEPGEPGEAVELAKKYQPDAVIINIAGEEELSAVGQIKESYGLPCLVMTHDSGEAIRETALKHGADDFLLIPIDWDALASRLRFLLGKPEERVGAVITLRFGRSKVEIDRRRRLLRRDGKDVALSQTEWALLQELADPPGEPRFDGELVVKVFGPQFRADSYYLGLWVTRLGEKLGDDPKNPRLIRRYHGAAYVLTPQESAESSSQP